MQDKIKVVTSFNDAEIRQCILYGDELLKDKVQQVINLREQGIREALIKLGWTPPPEKKT